jgi:hypothetical protein
MIRISHEYQLILISVGFKKLHKAVIIDYIVEIRVNSTVVVKMLQSVVIRLLDVHNFPCKVPGNVRIFEELDGVIEFSQ